jgi:hypothetical protein
MAVGAESFDEGGLWGTMGRDEGLRSRVGLDECRGTRCRGNAQVRDASRWLLRTAGGVESRWDGGRDGAGDRGLERASRASKSLVVVLSTTFVGNFTRRLGQLADRAGGPLQPQPNERSGAGQTARGGQAQRG